MLGVLEGKGLGIVLGIDVGAAPGISDGVMLGDELGNTLGAELGSIVGVARMQDGNFIYIANFFPSLSKFIMISVMPIKDVSSSTSKVLV